MSELFDYRKKPQIYVYSVPNQPGLKIGYTEKENVHDRIKQQLINTPNPQYKLEAIFKAQNEHGEYFTDRTIHRILKSKGFKQLATEWFQCSIADVKEAVMEAVTGIRHEPGRTQNFPLRPEQAQAVNETAAYFSHYDKTKSGRAPHFLWNAKMRFGKTFTAYQLAKKKGWQRILVLTYKPATEKAWREDLQNHVDFEGWQFIGGRHSWEQSNINENKPVVWFASYQDVLGKKRDTGTTKERHQKMREIEWDCLFIDEYHFGAWREAAKQLANEDETDADLQLSEKATQNFAKIEEKDEATIEIIEETNPLKINAFLYLSGTPFRAIANGEFSEDQIFNWTYADEQRAKRDWIGTTQNPYLELPRIIMMTYQMPEKLREVAMQGEFNEFDLNKFFAAQKNEHGEWVFTHENDVQKFLNNLRGLDLQVDVENKFDHIAPPLPYADARLLSSLTHTFWFLPRVASCKAMKRLLSLDPFFRDYEIICAAGADAGIGQEAIEPVEEKMGDPLHTKTITLSCGKLTTGVTIKAWSAVLFLRNTDSPETYFQTAFRAQSPWTIKSAENPNDQEIIKPTCYLLDFAPTRALKLIAGYSNELGSINDNRSIEKRLEEFIEFLPVLCYDGVSMTKLDAAAILDISTYGTASTMLARRWQSARLIDVTSIVLEKILDAPDILAALEKIEDFRNLRGEITKVINSEQSLKKSKKEREINGTEIDDGTKKKEAREEKENRDFKRKLREKLLKFITRIPVFMYLTDYREEKLIDVIRNLEPEMFTKVTGLTVRDFNRMCEVGVFNQMELNQAIFMFRRFEDSSLTYAGGRSTQANGEIGLFDTKITRAQGDTIYGIAT